MTLYHGEGPASEITQDRALNIPMRKAGLQSH